MSVWRTATVISLCEAIRQTGDYSGLPILADALDDADYPDQSILDQMRSEKMDHLSAQRLVALVYSDETAEAVRTIERLCEEMGPRAFCEEGDDYDDVKPTTYDRLIRVGDRWVSGWDAEWNSGDYTTEHGSENLRDGGWHDLGNSSKYWEAYRLITGRSGDGNPFSCSC